MEWLKRYPGKPLYLKNDDDRLVKNRGIRYSVNPNIAAIGLAIRRLYLVTQHIILSEGEAQAIAYHDGPYLPDNKTIAHEEG